MKKGKGSAIAIVVGGASESLAAHPGTADLTLRRRLGFIKIAIRNGADLVPVFSFGENDVYEQLSNEQGTRIYALQKKFQALFGFTLPFFHGRGLFNYSIGLMPYRHPIVSVGRYIDEKDGLESERVSLTYLHLALQLDRQSASQYTSSRTPIQRKKSSSVSRLCTSNNL